MENCVYCLFNQSIGDGPVLPPYSEHPKQQPGYPMPMPYGAPTNYPQPQFPPQQPYGNPYPQPYPAPNQVPYGQPGYGGPSQQAYYPPAPGPPAPVITQPGPAAGKLIKSIFNQNNSSFIMSLLQEVLNGCPCNLRCREIQTVHQV